MDRMEKEIGDEFENIDNAVRTALAFEKQAQHSGTLALLNRYATRHARDYHRALRQLREIQSERRDQPTPPASPNEESQNEPKPDVTHEPSTVSDVQITAAELATSRESLPTETGHRPLATDHYSSETGHRSPAPDHCSPLSYNNPTPIRRLDDQASDS
jgi:hypothetical protein